ncbi:Longin-like domain-containing protein [Entophlyctis helioformis]|nr:Longin-like domain-containing protein [Entophlyctis helioformis]
MVRHYANLSLVSVKAAIVLDSEGHRVLAKYYSADYPSAKEQKAFEKNLFDKTKRVSSEIILFDNLVVVYKSIVDVFIYFVGSMDENEIMLQSVLGGFSDALTILLKNQVEKRMMMDNMDVTLLTLDETVDDGIILETDASQIASRVTKRSTELESFQSGEQTIAQALKTAQEQLAKRFYT